MSGIYIHTPFCKQRCTYCDFYSETLLSYKKSLIDALTLEIEQRKNELKAETVKTIYFGGGTPSVLNAVDFQRLFDTIFSSSTVDEEAEITFEANPDDLTEEYFESIKKLPFNRISIGIQSFFDEDLKRINRRHNSQQAISAVERAKRFGFNNISIDLMYALPFQTMESWNEQIETALGLNVQHISAYGLTYEEGTVLWQQKEKGLLQTIDDETAIKMYHLLRNKLEKNGFEAYEISNFSLRGFRSRHNTSYWQQKPYIGIGPSAHSYNGKDIRRWNFSSVVDYIENINGGGIYFEEELLSPNNKYNDYVMVSLRTTEGIDLNVLKKQFGPEVLDYCLKQIRPFMDSGKVILENGFLKLTLEGISISNLILVEIIKVEES